MSVQTNVLESQRYLLACPPTAQALQVLHAKKAEVAKPALMGQQKLAPDADPRRVIAAMRNAYEPASRHEYAIVQELGPEGGNRYLLSGEQTCALRRGEVVSFKAAWENDAAETSGVVVEAGRSRSVLQTMVAQPLSGLGGPTLMVAGAAHALASHDYIFGGFCALIGATLLRKTFDLIVAQLHRRDGDNFAAFYLDKMTQGEQTLVHVTTSTRAHTAPDA